MTIPEPYQYHELQAMREQLQYFYQTRPDLRPHIAEDLDNLPSLTTLDGRTLMHTDWLRQQIRVTRKSWRTVEGAAFTPLGNRLRAAERDFRGSLRSWVPKHEWTTKLPEAEPRLVMERLLWADANQYEVTPTHGIVKLMKLADRLGNPPLYAARRHVLRLRSEPTIVMEDQYAAAKVDCLWRSKDMDSHNDPRIVIVEDMWWVTSHGLTSIAQNKATAINGVRRRAETVVTRKLEEQLYG